MMPTGHAMPALIDGSRLLGRVYVDERFSISAGALYGADRFTSRDFVIANRVQSRRYRWAPYPQRRVGRSAASALQCGCLRAPALLTRVSQPCSAGCGWRHLPGR